MTRFLSTQTIDTPAKAEAMVEHYLQQEAFAFDVETTGDNRLQPVVAPVVWLSMATEGRTDVIPLGHPHGELVRPAYSYREKFYDENVLTERTKVPKAQHRTVRVPTQWTAAPQQMKPSVFWPIVQPLFESPDIIKVGHNLKFDLKAVWKYCPNGVSGPFEDTMGMAHLLNENALKGLKSLVEKGNRAPKNTDRFFSGYGHKYDTENVGKCVEKHPFSKVARYAALDAMYTYWLWLDLGERLALYPDVEEVFFTEMELYHVLLDMELYGQPVDRQRMFDLATELAGEVHDAQREVYREAGETFDIGSTATVSRILFEDRGNEITKRSSKTNKPSVAKDVLLEMADPLSERILEYRALQKMVSTYVGVLGENGKVEGGLYDHIFNDRIHTDFRPFGTVTGRFSSATPNLQNVPRRGDRASLIRSMFVAEPGSIAVVADYSQIEYRVLAHYSQDETLIEAFANGYDPHAAVAAMLLGKNIEDITPEERDMGKTFNFAQIYGAGDAKLAVTLGVGLRQVQAFRKDYRLRFPRISKFNDYVIRMARSRPDPYISTLLGRRRYLPALNWSNRELRSQAERQAVNSLVQGSSADVIKVAMLDVADGLRERPDSWHMTLTVHDELMLLVPEADGPEGAKFLQQTMEAVDMIEVPLVAEAAYGPSWADAK